ncbi:MAG: dTDP-4-dehydrorhamnose 3,5-epimerase [Nitrospirales bacterium]|nr:dTDP-4-dehydrorhamnose 3,5-epimerase [Nitrospirales bacterium]
MIFHETPLKNAYYVNVDKVEDERGFFARVWCRETFAENGLALEMVQGSISFNKKKGTLRGMHFQVPPYAETKIVRCTQGRLFDVILDLRPGSVTYKQWHGVELTAKNRKMLVIPPGFAHGFQTLEDDTEVFYLISEFYHPEAARGVRWNDQAFAIKWPETEQRIISQRDQQWPNYVQE